MMSQRSSVVELRQELRDLDAQRRAIEEEISLLSERLNAPGQPGTKGGLLDKQGFPRADIDVLQVRRDRHRLICLTNDQKALTDKLAKLLAEMHEAVRNSQGDGAATTSGTDATPGAGSAPASAAGSADAAAGVEPAVGTAAAMDVDSGAGTSTTAAAGSGGAAGASALRPFALVDEVSGGSPAEAAGVQVGDLLCAFGDVSAGEGGGGGGGSSALQRVAAVLAASEGRPVAARVLRQGAPLELSLTPARWQGRGLLGCHLRPL